MKNTKYKLAVDRKKEIVSKYGGKNLSKRLNKVYDYLITIS